MLDLLMCSLGTFFPRFHRRRLEGVGVCGCRDGFNPDWVYAKYGFEPAERLSQTAVVMARSLDVPQKAPAAQTAESETTQSPPDIQERAAGPAECAPRLHPARKEV